MSRLWIARTGLDVSACPAAQEIYNRLRNDSDFAAWIAAVQGRTESAAKR